MDAGEPRVTLVGRAGCHLCEQARVVVHRVCAETGSGWREVSVDDDPDLLHRYGEEVPVVLVDGARHAYWHVDEARLREALAPRSERRRRWPRGGAVAPGPP